MLNLAVIGCGRMATDLAHRSVKLGRARIAAIHDIDPQALDVGCAAFGADPVPQIEALLERKDIDAFLVGSPGLYHHDNVIAVAPAGKPIYSEKPLCTTVALCNEMIETCHKHSAKLFVGQVLRLFPLFWKSYEVIQSGHIGTPQVCVITRAGQPRHHTTGWRSNMRESGGPLLEVNAHELDYMLWLLGEAETVYAQGLNLNGWGDFNDAMLVQIAFKNGGMGTLHASNSSPVGDYHVHLQCTNGNLIHGGFGGELRYRSFEDTATAVITAESLADRPSGYDRELTSFFDWAEYDTPPLFTGETGRANVALAEAAYRSMSSGKPEPVTQF